MPGRVKYRGRAAAMRRKDGALIMISQAPIFTIHAELADIRHFGTTPYGERRVVDISALLRQLGWVVVEQKTDC